MKTKLFTYPLILFLHFSAVIVQAQSPVTGILYTYDASGNRIKRELAPGYEERKANPNPGTEEKQNLPEVVTQNNIVASFTPNPTTTGNFTVMVSSKDLSNQNTSTEKANIFIYNPLGELIQQKSAQYDNHVYIDLSNLSKGVYLVKVQSGENEMMKKVVYQ